MRRQALLGIGLICALAACNGGAGGEPKSALANAGESWCPDGFEAGPNDTCFAIPEHAAPNAPVLVYLHGMYTGRGDADEWRVVHTAVDRGFAVVMPRGKRGLCAWRAELKDHFCWPQDPEDTEAIEALIGEWGRVLWQVEALLEGDAHQRFVLGFSNGGSFAQYLAARGGFQAKAYAIVNAAPLVAPSPPQADGARPGVLLVSGSEDAEHAPKMEALDAALSTAGWAHQFCARPGGHALTAGDVGAALGFFERAGQGEAAAVPADAGYRCDAR